MNIIFVCGVVKELPEVEKGDKIPESRLKVFLPCDIEEDISEILCFARSEETIKRVSKIKPYDLIFLSGTMTDKGIIILDFSVISKFSSKEKAFRKMLELNTINQGLLCGEIVGWDEETSCALIEIKRDEGVYYGDLKDKDVLRVKTKAPLVPGKFIALRVKIGKDKIITF